jgi:LacI family transcriptional regulator, gluconate utilization system Gnt-I transcriptional repressor
MPEKDLPKKSRRSTGAMTLRDVAKLAGVAPITASRALNTPDQVSAEVLRKVQEAVVRTGYVPNRMAGGLASSRSRLIAAVTPSTVMTVLMGTIESLNGTLFDAGYQLMLGQTSYSAEREAALLEAIIGRRPDGIFLTGLLPPGKGRTMLLASGIPVVESWDLTPTPIDMLIGFSHVDIGREVARYLAGRGHRKMAMVRANDERAHRRATAFNEEVVQQGLPPVVEVNVGAMRSIQGGRDALTRLLQMAPDVDAVFCSSDLLALGVLTQARVLGLDVPGQLAIMGFGDTPLASDVVPALSSVRINGEEIGRLAALYLMARAEGREVAQPMVDVGFSIMARDSA